VNATIVYILIRTRPEVTHLLEYQPLLPITHCTYNKTIRSNIL